MENLQLLRVSCGHEHVNEKKDGKGHYVLFVVLPVSTLPL